MTTVSIDMPAKLVPVFEGQADVRGAHGFTVGPSFSKMPRMKRPDLSERNTKHGMTKTHPQEYRSWKDMRRRCNNPASPDWADYGGRGISVCKRWDNFADFVADMGVRVKGASIDRIDVDGDYEPENCRWATAKQQANNKRSNHIIERNGVSKTLQQWSDEFGVDSSKARYRIKRGYPFETVFSNADLRK